VVKLYYNTNKKLGHKMAKGKKTIIKDIKRVSDDIVMVNQKEYVIIEDEKDIETATTMKISSHGNRLLRFEDPKKMATIDLKREIKIVKVTFTDKHRANRFKKSQDKSIVTQSDKRETIATTNSYIKARQIISQYTSKSSDNYDKDFGINSFYISHELKPKE
jgi:hypothetical protein